MKKKKKLYNKIVFTTRKDFFFIISLIMLIVAFLCFFIILLSLNKYLEAIIALIFLFIFTSFLFNNEILLEKYYIRINFGIFSYCIKYKDIKSLYIVDNHISSLASSVHKVGIKTSKYKSIIFDTFVSPFDREDFIYEVNLRI